MPLFPQRYLGNLIAYRRMLKADIYDRNRWFAKLEGR